MVDTTTNHIGCIAQNMRGLPVFRKNADDLDALAAERDALKADVERLEEMVAARHANPSDFRYWEGRYRDEKAENEVLKVKLGESEASLDDRMKAMGMIPLTELIEGPPLPFSVHAGCNDMDFFKKWVERRYRSFLTMRMRYETGELSKGDELFEWVFAHASAFGQVHEHLQQAMKGGGDDA